MIRKGALLVGLLCVLPSLAHADERFFTNAYETERLPEGGLEFEQHMNEDMGRKGGDYNRWESQSEIEYGITDRLTTELYLNLHDTETNGFKPGTLDSDPNTKEGFRYDGLSSEWLYQILNPNLNPVGVVAYEEFTWDGLNYELEQKLIFSQEVERFRFAFNAIYEMEFNRTEDATQDKEAELGFTGGVAYRITDRWSAGVEFRNNSEFPGGLNLSGREAEVWYVGPNVHYNSGKSWWITASFLPQVWGNGEGASGGLQLSSSERFQAQVILGVEL